MRWLVIVLALVALGCPPSSTQVQARAQAQVANTIAVATNPVLVQLAETYARQGELLIERAKSRQEAVALLEAHRTRWRPVWAAVDALGAAHNAWATALEQGVSDPASAAAFVAAWCELEDVAVELGLSKKLPALPEVVPCP